MLFTVCFDLDQCAVALVALGALGLACIFPAIAALWANRFAGGLDCFCLRCWCLCRGVRASTAIIANLPLWLPIPARIVWTDNILAILAALFYRTLHCGTHGAEVKDH